MDLNRNEDLTIVENINHNNRRIQHERSYVFFKTMLRGLLSLNLTSNFLTILLMSLTFYYQTFMANIDTPFKKDNYDTYVTFMVTQGLIMILQIFFFVMHIWIHNTIINNNELSMKKSGKIFF